MYKDDFQGKGLSMSIKMEWLLRQALATLTISFLFAFTVGIIYYSHYHFKKESDRFIPFAKRALYMVALMSAVSFLYESFLAPRNAEKSMRLLSEIVYARSAGELQVQLEQPISGPKDIKMLTLPELYRAKDSLQKNMIDQKADNSSYRLSSPEADLKKIRYSIGVKTAYPFLVFFFYILAVLLAFLFRRIPAIAPLLIGYFGLSAAWYYAQEAIRKSYMKGDVGFITGAYGVMFITGMLAIAGWWLYNRVVGNRAADLYDQSV